MCTVMRYNCGLLCHYGILFHVVITAADIISLCSEDAVLSTNTLNLQLEDIYADIHRPEVDVDT